MAVKTRRKIGYFEVTRTVLLETGILFSLFVNAQTGITTKPSVIEGLLGQSAVLPCQASNTNSKLDWWFLNHQIQISSGHSVLVNDVNKYTLVFPQDNSGRVAINLLIRDLKSSDSGYYRCLVHGSAESITHELSIRGAPVIPSNLNTTAANFTACCRQEGVSEQCMPACFPSSVNRDMFNETEVCASDLNKLLKCFSDSRNHIACCRRRLLPEECLDFCANKPPVLSLVHLGCLQRVDDIISCFEEGQVLLPSSPVKVSALNLPHYKILVSWLPPLENAKLVTGYRVSYRQTTDKNGPYSHTAILPDFTSQYTLQGLAANMRYTIYVTAIGKYGSSQPSERIDIPTSDDISQPGQDTDIKACCVARNVTSVCRDLLCSTSVLKQWNPHHLISCYPELENIFTCVKGERDHTACCVQNGIPAICQDFCGLKPPSFQWEFVECVSDKRLSIIEACVQQGLKTLPSAPRSVSLSSVDSHSAVITWSLPLSGDRPGQMYLVQLRKKNSPALFKNMNTVVGMFTELTSLSPDTLYEVRVMTVGNDSTSLPSPVITFITKPDIDVNTPDQNVGINNETACCLRANVSSECMPGCTYNQQQLLHFFRDMSKLILCFKHIENMIKCGSDGKNHTSCCQSRGVFGICTELCSLAEDDQVSIKYTKCFDKALNIIQCYEEGRVTLPKHPDGLVVGKVTSNTISLSWNHPTSGSRVDKYIVQYKTESQRWQQDDTNSTRTSYIIQNLKHSHNYEIRVVSANSNGTSVPSPTVTVLTLPGNETAPPKVRPNPLGKQIFQNNSDCCVNSGVAPECQKLCQNQEGSTSPCYHDADKIIACGSDGKDHSLCCKKRGVPTVCQSLCRGHSGGQNFETLSCLTYTLAIRTCFYENDGLIPTPPTHFTTTELSNNSHQLTWMTPAKQCDTGCTYNVHYWEVSATDTWSRIYSSTGAITIKNVVSPFILSNLKPFKAYRVTVTAHNQYGGSQPAPSQSFYVEHEGIQNILIFRHPRYPAVLKKGQRVIFSCVVSAKPEARIFWMFNNRNITGATGRKLTIKSLDITKAGIYTCVAFNSEGTKRLNYYLNVQDKPSIVKVVEANVAPNEHRTASLVCWFSGNPDRISWTKNGKVVNAVPGKLKVFSEHREHTGIIVGKLKFADVVSKDLGMYRCNGSNSYGFAIGAVQLIDPDEIRHVKPGSKPSNITACCIKEQVTSQCLVACSFDIDLKKVFNNPRLLVCLNHLEAYVKCSADGRDHSRCCVDSGVSDVCVPFCKGVVPGGNLITCADHATTIINCMVKGHDNIPSPPLNIYAKLKSGAIDVHWSAPAKNAEKVDKYDVFFNSSKLKTQHHSVSRTIYNYIIQIPAMESQGYVNVWIVATNDFGQSQRSKIKHILLKKSEFEVSRSSSMKDNKPLAVGLGLGITIAVLIVIAVIVFFVIRKTQGKSRFATETVAFENPGYGRTQPQITGLPADTMQPVGQFAYGKLEESTDHTNTEPLPSHPYETIDNVHLELESNGNTPATLPVNQEDHKPTQ